MRNYLVTVLIIVVGLTTSYLINKNNKKEYFKKIKAEEYFGIVDSIFLDPDSRMQPKAMLINGLKVSVQNDVYKNIGPRDTLFKNAGSYNYYWIHAGDTTIYYQEFDGEQLKN